MKLRYPFCPQRYDKKLGMGNGNSDYGGDHGGKNDRDHGGKNDEKNDRDRTGLEDHCYYMGFDHGAGFGDPVGDGLGVIPCTLDEGANKAYGEGYKDGAGL